jgi:peptidyl-prolyl cis-trans isomerase SurA
MMVRSLCLIVSLVLVLTAFGPARAKAEVVDRIVAIVNDEIITLKDVERFVEVKGKGKYSSVNSYFLGMQLRDKLDALVESLLIIQQAAKMKIEVGEREVEGVVENIRKQNLISDTQLRDQLKSEGINYKDFVEGIRKSLLTNRVLARVVAPDLYLDESKLKEFYQQHIDDYRENEFKLHHILISGQRSDAGARSQQAYKLLQEGQPFASVAKEYSDDASAAEGGDIGTIKQEELMPELRDVLNLLLPGSFSHPVPSPYGFHIIKLVEARKNHALPFDAVKDSVRERLVQIESERRYKEYVQKLKASSYIEVKI